MPKFTVEIYKSNSYGMTILEQILAGLQQKFTGVDTAILTRIATKKAEGVTDETKVNSIVEGWKIQCKLPPKTKRFCPLVLK